MTPDVPCVNVRTALGCPFCGYTTIAWCTNGENTGFDALTCPNGCPRRDDDEWIWDEAKKWGKSPGDVLSDYGYASQMDVVVLTKIADHAVDPSVDFDPNGWVDGGEPVDV